MLPDKRLCSHLIFDDTQRDTLVCTFGCCAGFCRLGSHPLQESAQRHYVSILCWKALHCHSVASAVVGLNEQCARENAQDMLTLLQQLKPHMQYCNMTYAEPQH